MRARLRPCDTQLDVVAMAECLGGELDVVFVVLDQQDLDRLRGEVCLGGRIEGCADDVLDADDRCDPAGWPDHRPFRRGGP